MTETQRIAKSAGIPLLERRGLALVNSAHAPAFLDAVCAAGARILAIDGVTVRGEELTADPEAESDFTDIDDLDLVADEAAQFLGRFAPADDLYFQFVLDED